jgi:NADH-quinone oxidoreductase subunit M
MMLSGIMLKMGVYGALRWLLPIVPAGVAQNQEWVMTLGVIGVVYGSIIALKQSDIKRIVAYSSFAHVGLMAAALFTLTSAGISGTIMQMLSHGLTVTGLFLVVHHIDKSLGRREVGSLGGMAAEAPRFAVYFMVILLGSVALPLTSGFVGEFLMLYGLSQTGIWWAIIAGTTVILSAVYMLRMFQTALLGQKVDARSGLRPLTLAEHVVFMVLVVLIMALGVYPKPILDLIEPSVQQLISLAKTR